MHDDDCFVIVHALFSYGCLCYSEPCAGIPFALFISTVVCVCAGWTLQFELLFQYGRTVYQGHSINFPSLFISSIFTWICLSTQLCIFINSMHEGLNQTCSETNPIEQQQQKSAHGEICIGIGIVCGSIQQNQMNWKGITRRWILLHEYSTRLQKL